MIVERGIAGVRDRLDAARRSGGDVGFVPTMGALHEGHRSLMQRARRYDDLVCVSIYVNPAQFDAPDDFRTYPRTQDHDLAVCEAERVDVVFVPDDAEMYPEPPLTGVRVRALSDTLEGAHRPGHFDGVALVCAKLFGIVGGCRAYFGAKDAQQLVVVRRLVADLNLPVEIVECPTVRDPDGLALSSRNVLLGPDERRRALALPRALRAVERSLVDSGDDVADALAVGLDVMAGEVDVEYLACVDPRTLEPVEDVRSSVLVLGAVRVGDTRLIDNVVAVVSPRAVPAAGIGREDR